MYGESISQGIASGRSPHGERGLKYCGSDLYGFGVKSLPTRGAWIEMAMNPSMLLPIAGRSPHGERGLKYIKFVEQIVHVRRSPHGERGLKLKSLSVLKNAFPVAPHTGSVD